MTRSCKRRDDTLNRISKKFEKHYEHINKGKLENHYKTNSNSQSFKKELRYRAQYIVMTTF